MTGPLIFTLLWPEAALMHIHVSVCVCVCVCVSVCYNVKSKSGNSSFLSRLHLTKSGSSVKNAAEHLTLGGCYDNQKSLETHKQTAWTAPRLLKSPRPRLLRALAGIQHVSSHVRVHTHTHTNTHTHTHPTQHIRKKTSVSTRDRRVISSAGHLDLEFNDFQGMVWWNLKISSSSNLAKIIRHPSVSTACLLFNHLTV